MGVPHEGWQPPRLVSLTIDETVVALGVIQLLAPDADPDLRVLAERAMEKLRERIAAVGEADLTIVRDA